MSGRRTATPARPEAVEGYRIDGLLGEGGMGVVFRATQLSLGREVALKVLHAGVSGDPEVRQRFLQEGRLAARITHPNVVRVLEVGESAGRLFLAYELVDGATLRQRLAREVTLGVAEAVELGAGVLDVLDTLHSAGVLHRDLKPENLFLSAARGVLVGDLGIAKDLLGGGVHTQEGMMLGTPAYMAPELVTGRPASPASDLYALGIVLFECLAGRLPFDAPDPVEILQLHVTQPVPELATWRPDLAHEYGAFFERALAKSPKDRFAGAAAMKGALKELPQAGPESKRGTRETPAPARAATGSATRRLSRSSSPRAPSAATLRTAARGPTVSRSAACAAGLLVLAGVGVLLRLAAPRSAPPKPVAAAPLRPATVVAVGPSAFERAAGAAREVRSRILNELGAYRKARAASRAPIEIPMATAQLGAIWSEGAATVEKLLVLYGSVAPAASATAPQVCAVAFGELLRGLDDCEGEFKAATTGLLQQVEVGKFRENLALSAKRLLRNCPPSILESKDVLIDLGLASLRTVALAGEPPAVGKTRRPELQQALEQGLLALVRHGTLSAPEVRIVEAHARILRLFWDPRASRKSLALILQKWPAGAPADRGRALSHLILGWQLADAVHADEFDDAEPLPSFRRRLNDQTALRDVLQGEWPRSTVSSGKASEDSTALNGMHDQWVWLLSTSIEGGRSYLREQGVK